MKKMRMYFFTESKWENWINSIHRHMENEKNFKWKDTWNRHFLTYKLQVTLVIPEFSLDRPVVTCHFLLFLTDILICWLLILICTTDTLLISFPLCINWCMWCCFLLFHLLHLNSFPFVYFIFFVPHFHPQTDQYTKTNETLLLSKL